MTSSSSWIFAPAFDTCNFVHSHPSFLRHRDRFKTYDWRSRIWTAGLSEGRKQVGKPIQTQRLASCAPSSSGLFVRTQASNEPRQNKKNPAGVRRDLAPGVRKRASPSRTSLPAIASSPAWRRSLLSSRLFGSYVNPGCGPCSRVMVSSGGKNRANPYPLIWMSGHDPQARIPANMIPETIQYLVDARQPC